MQHNQQTTQWGSWSYLEELDLPYKHGIPPHASNHHLPLVWDQKEVHLQVHHLFERVSEKRFSTFSHLFRFQLGTFHSKNPSTFQVNRCEQTRLRLLSRPIRTAQERRSSPSAVIWGSKVRSSSPWSQYRFRRWTPSCQYSRPWNASSSPNAQTNGCPHPKQVRSLRQGQLQQRQKREEPRYPQRRDAGVEQKFQVTVNQIRFDSPLPSPIIFAENQAKSFTQFTYAIQMSLFLNSTLLIQMLAILIILVI